MLIEALLIAWVGEDVYPQPNRDPKERLDQGLGPCEASSAKSLPILVGNGVRNCPGRHQTGVTSVTSVTQARVFVEGSAGAHGTGSVSRGSAECASPDLLGTRELLETPKLEEVMSA